MKKLIQIGSLLLTFALVGFNNAQAQGTGDSIVQIAAEVQGLEAVSSDSLGSLPVVGTYWLAMPGGGFLPSPLVPMAPAPVIYPLADNIFLVDETSGLLPRSDTVNDALEIESNAVVNLINQIQTRMATRALRMAYGMDSPPAPGEGDGGDDSDYPTNTYVFSLNTNLLWLEITNVSGELAYASLHQATNDVYAIWSTTNLSLADSWRVETEVWPADTNCQPFQIPTFNRQNLFLRAEDWTGVDSNGDGIPDWWIFYWYGNLDETATNYDSSGTHTLLHDYTNSLDPNVLQFSVVFTNSFVNSQTATGQLAVYSGMPSEMAVLVNNTNYTAAVWQPFTFTNFVASLGTSNGTYSVYVGLKVSPVDPAPVWTFGDITLYHNAPWLTLTNLTGAPVSHPFIQLRGRSSQPLGTLTFDSSNSAGVYLNQPGLLTGLAYDPTARAATTNYFESPVLYLAAGSNWITLHVTDVAGGVTNFTVALDYVPDTNAPSLALLWPLPGTPVTGSNITLQAQASDSAAGALASVNGITTGGMIEAGGRVWVQNLALVPGTNAITLTVSNVYGQVTSTNFNVVENDLGLTVDPLPMDQLNQPYVTVTGFMADTNDCVYVNGTNAYYVDDAGDWEADYVPVNPAGTAVLHVQVYVGDPTLIGEQQITQPQPPLVVLTGYSGRIYDAGASLYAVVLPGIVTTLINWSYDAGGTFLDYGEIANYLGTADMEISGSDDLAASDANFTPPGSLDITPDYFSASATFLGGTGYTETFQRSCQTQIGIVPSGQQPAGANNVYLLLVSAMQILGPAGDVNFGESAGSTPVTDPTTIKGNGQALTTTSLTNSDGTVSGFTLVSAPAGQTPLETLTASTSAVTFSSAQARDVLLQIIDTNTGTNLSAQTNTVIVGQQMNLTCRLSITNSYMTNYALTNFQWTVPGQTVKQSIQFLSYDTNGTATSYGTNTPLQSGDLLTNPVSFFWINGGTNLEVDCAATVQGKSIDGKAIFNVLRPLSSFMAITSTNIPAVNVVTDNYGAILLQYGSASTAGNAGIFFNMSVATPTSGSGAFGFLQVVKGTLRRWILNDNYKTAQKSEGTNLLDHYPGYAPISILASVSSGATNSLTFADEPGQALQVGAVSNVWASVNDNFSSYLMYRPSGNTNQTIWVTLQKIAWSWSGGATNEGGSWTLESNYPPPPANPSSTSTFELPNWNGTGRANLFL